MSTLLEQWKDIAYDETADRGQLSRLKKRSMKSCLRIRTKK